MIKNQVSCFFWDTVYCCVSKQLDPRSAASRHTTAPISHTKPSPRSKLLLIHTSTVTKCGNYHKSVRMEFNNELLLNTVRYLQLNNICHNYVQLTTQQESNPLICTTFSRLNTTSLQKLELMLRYLWATFSVQIATMENGHTVNKYGAEYSAIENCISARIIYHSGKLTTSRCDIGKRTLSSYHKAIDSTFHTYALRLSKFTVQSFKYSHLPVEKIDQWIIITHK